MIYPTPIHDPFPAWTTRPSEHRPWSNPLRSARSRCVADLNSPDPDHVIRQAASSSPLSSGSRRIRLWKTALVPLKLFQREGQSAKISDRCLLWTKFVYLRKREIDRTKNWVATWRRNFSENITDAEVDKEAYSSVDMPTTSFEKDRMARRWMWIETDEDWERIAFKLKEVRTIQETRCFDSRTLPLSCYELLETNAKENNDKIISLKRNRFLV